MSAAQPELGATIVALEGIDGAGKSTCAPRVAATLEQNLRGLATVRHTGEFESPLGKKLKERLGSLTSLEKLYWFAADRASTLAGLIAPVTTLPRVVIWDRYTPSAFAYRFADGLTGDAAATYQLVTSVNSAFPPPDIVLLFQLETHLAIGRRGTGSEEFLRAVSDGYKAWISKNAAVSVEYIDASKTKDDIVLSAANAIESALRLKGVIS